jgi:hypothetical protein
MAKRPHGKGAGRKAGVEMPDDHDIFRHIVNNRDALRNVLNAAAFYRQTALSIAELRVTESDLIQFVAA